MPIKKIKNIVNIKEMESVEILTFLTSCKKNHFSCSEAKLFELLESCFYESNRYYQVHLTTYPFIGVHVCGRSDKLDGKQQEFQNKIFDLLTANLKPI